ncbi:MAG: UbiA family prenyltransferase [Gammaproteobacteria bacterium]|nr:UbiA family prenyltransferase [Gammaproteobacteria bacterium]
MNDHTTIDAAHLDSDIDAILDSAKRMFIATSVDGNSSGASVFFARDGVDLLFFTFNPSRKAEQIRTNPRVQVAIWPADQSGIRGLQIEGNCELIKDTDARQRAREAILQVTTAFKDYMDDEFLTRNNVVGYYRIKPITVKLVDFHSSTQFQWREFPENRVSAWRELVNAVGSRTLLWLRALRAPFFTATLIPVLLGALIAYGDQRTAGITADWDWSRFWLVVIGALCAHAGTNLANDFGDHLSRNDEWNKVPSPFNGGSRVIQAGLLAPWKIALAAVLCLVAVIAIGLRLNTTIGGSPLAPTPLLGVGLLGCLLGAAYTLGPYRLSYRGWGELAIALGFGPVMVLGAHYVMTAGVFPTWQWMAPLLASLPIALLVTMIVWINEFQDVPADRKAGKQTWLVRTAYTADGSIHYERPLRIYQHLGVASLVLILLLAFLGFAAPSLGTPFALLALPGLLLGVYAMRTTRRWLPKWNAPDADRQRLPYELLAANAATIGMHFVTGILLIAAYGVHALTQG